MSSRFDICLLLYVIKLTGWLKHNNLSLCLSLSLSLFSLVSVHVVIVRRSHATQLWCLRVSVLSAKHLHSSCTPIHFVLLYMLPRNITCVVAACMFM